MMGDWERIGNQVEAVFWIVVGLAFAVPPLLRRPHPGLCGAAFVTLIAFGLSDLVEVWSGAWWRPWWLPAWKTACVAALARLLQLYYQRKKSCSSGVGRNKSADS